MWEDSINKNFKSVKYQIGKFVVKYEKFWVLKK